MIVTGGENVWPAPVEAALRRHPGVAEVGVAGRPDPEWGQRVVAWVVPADAARPPGLAELRAIVAERVAPYAAPRRLVISSTTCRGPSIGKVRRDDLPDPASVGPTGPSRSTEPVTRSRPLGCGALIAADLTREERPMQTEAAILWEPKTEWSVEPIELDPPKEGEVLVKLAASGMCHSDEHLVTGDLGGVFPIIGGHEGAGRGPGGRARA